MWRDESKRCAERAGASGVATVHTGQVQVEAVLLVADLLLRDRAAQGVAHVESGLFFYLIAVRAVLHTGTRRPLLVAQTLCGTRGNAVVTAVSGAAPVVGGVIALVILVVVVVIVILVLVGKERLGLCFGIRGAKVARVCCATEGVRRRIACEVCSVNDESK